MLTNLMINVRADVYCISITNWVLIINIPVKAHELKSPEKKYILSNFATVLKTDKNLDEAHRF